eukprot:TRINITY_DN55328_c0_g1_i1.p1 TRINITY_DN55328_c0_g1~~TRINITY_DN55328_c0_g1_i1.p1  ORF type:complete len:491 (-),score=103.18 TRINITY_DN55328_c0_g1_i1:167-1564(-)
MPNAAVARPIAIGAVSAAIALGLIGCGGGGGPTPSPTPAPTPTPAPGPAPPPAPPESCGPHCTKCLTDGCAVCESGFLPTGGDDGTQRGCLYACSSDLALGPLVAAGSKGLALDDTTHHWCADSMHSRWPNTDNPVQSFRVTKAWEVDWTETSKAEAWRSIARFAHVSGAKALVGTQITCNETEDDADWHDVKLLLQALGPAHVMGLAVGNELEILFMKQDIPAECIQNMWDGGYLRKKFHSRVQELDAMGEEWKAVKVTSPFGGFINSGEPYVNTPQARVLDFLQDAVGAYKSRYSFSLNIYPYFDPGNAMDPGTPDQCELAIARDTCFNSSTCVFPATVIDARKRMQRAFTSVDIQLWVTETGWSAPKAHTLTGPMVNCPAFSSEKSLRTYYENFLKWDMQVEEERGPDHVFFFTMRDSQNFGFLEHFGLGGSGDPTKLCVNTTCKLQRSSFLDQDDFHEVVV